MAEAAGKRRGRGSGPGWASGLFLVLVLCSLGFAIGVALGLFVENPDIVIRHGRGESEEIPWAIDAVPEAEGSGAPNSMAEKLVSEAPVLGAANSSKASNRNTANQGRSGFLVQVGSFAARASALRQVGLLEEKGFVARVFVVSKEGKKSWRVRIGPVAKRAEAQKISRALEGAGFSTWVLADDGASGS